MDKIDYILDPSGAAALRQPLYMKGEFIEG